MRNNRKNIAVSDVVGTVLLLGITVALFSTLCFGVLSYPFSPSAPAVNIVGTRVGSDLILEHRGGEALSLDTRVIISIGIGDDPPLSLIVGEGEYLTEEAKHDNRWGIGEGFVYNNEEMNGHRVMVTVVDIESNSVIMLGTFQGV